jgi:hypothetical protein
METYEMPGYVAQQRWIAGEARQAGGHYRSQTGQPQYSLGILQLFRGGCRIRKDIFWGFNPACTPVEGILMAKARGVLRLPAALKPPG